jgi:DtxR family transcriptional regulator, Mn-dependent transcriptional regulator
MEQKAYEDYLKYIYELQLLKDDFIKVADIAKHFDYTEQSVYEMVKKLDQNDWVNYMPYKGVQLTKKGQNEALRMVRAHRIWEVFLERFLGYSWDEVHEEAESLEHASSDTLLERIYELLDAPTHCQHGNPIPNREGVIPKIAKVSLVELHEGQTFLLKRVLDEPELLKYLKQKGIELNTIFEVMKRDDFHEYIIFKTLHQQIEMTYKTASMLFGEVLS